ncbi:YcaO-like family protein [Corynebacterium sp.]|uniref:YcaO-like family protein n=1 Tax=Corynebacterium sp. TaxID=1720 RepID=UPI0026DB902E|nr:YcaO-like family protein [Corynebacterium sp.]MDO5032915.1 YcaO-like family protein [Corynebacterium sp.]
MQQINFSYSIFREGSLSVATLQQLSSGIGFGTNQPKLRARAEALERFWQVHGPSNHAHIYNLEETNEPTQVVFDGTDANYVDSSGTAIHTSPVQAILNAALEFLERLSIVAHWRFHTKGRSLAAPYDNPSQVYRNIHVREISLFDGISVCLALNDSPSKRVKYAAGAAAGFTQKETAANALRECLQAILLMQDNLLRSGTKRQLMDEIQYAYFSANNPETVSQWPTIETTATLHQDSHIETVLSALLPIKTLKSLPNPPLLLLDKIFFDGTPWYIARIMSDYWPSGLLDCRTQALKNLSQFSRRAGFTEAPVPFG